MDKGLLSNASQDVLLAKVKALMASGEKPLSPVLVLVIVLVLKGGFLYGDDVVADQKLPKELTEKSRALFDAILVAKDWDAALIIAVDLVPYLYDLFKPKP